MRISRRPPTTKRFQSLRATGWVIARMVVCRRKLRIESRTQVGLNDIDLERTNDMPQFKLPGRALGQVRPE